jgi:HD superfamily phosphohydrolase YqeK
MKQETSPVITGLTSDMLKALPEKAMEHLTLIIQKFWKGEEDHKVWHTMLLKALYKGKCKINNPRNLRGVCLK